jgi:hypothetical protein
MRPRDSGAAAREITAWATDGYPAEATPISTRAATASSGERTSGRAALAAAAAPSESGSRTRGDRRRASASHSTLPAPKPTAKGSRKIAAPLPSRPSSARTSAATGTRELAEA